MSFDLTARELYAVNAFHFSEEFHPINAFEFAAKAWAESRLVCVGEKAPESIGESALAEVFNALMLPAQIEKSEKWLIARFEFQEKKFALTCALDGSNFVSISGWWRFGDNAACCEMLSRGNRVSHDYKYVKAYWSTSEKSLLLSVEFIAVGPSELRSSLREYLGVIADAADALTD